MSDMEAIALRGKRDQYVRTTEARIKTVIQRYRPIRKDGRGDLVCSEYDSRINNKAAANARTDAGMDVDVLLPGLIHVKIRMASSRTEKTAAVLYYEIKSRSIRGRKR